MSKLNLNRKPIDTSVNWDLLPFSFTKLYDDVESNVGSEEGLVAVRELTLSYYWLRPWLWEDVT